MKGIYRLGIVVLFLIAVMSLGGCQVPTLKQEAQPEKAQQLVALEEASGQAMHYSFSTEKTQLDFQPNGQVSVTLEESYQWLLRNGGDTASFRFRWVGEDNKPVSIVQAAFLELREVDTGSVVARIPCSVGEAELALHPQADGSDPGVLLARER